MFIIQKKIALNVNNIEIKHAFGARAHSANDFQQQMMDISVLM